MKYFKPDPSPRPQHLERAFYAVARSAVLTGSGRNAEEIAAELWPNDEITPLLTRGATSPATTTTPAWAGALTQDAVGDFVSGLAPISAAARLRNAGMKVALTGRSMKIPRRSGAPTTPSWISESGPIPVANYALDSATLGPHSKLGKIIPLTREVVTHTSGQAVITTMLREDFAAGLDSVVFGTAAAVAGTSPAGLLNGVSALSATTGGTADENMRRDLEKLAGVIADNRGSSVVFVASTRQALAAQMRLPRADQITIWPSASLAPGTVVCVEPDAFVSSLGDVSIDQSDQGAVHFEDTTPLQLASGSGPTIASPIFSPFQSDLIMVRCMLDVAFTLRQAGMISYMTGVSWGAATP